MYLAYIQYFSNFHSMTFVSLILPNGLSQKVQPVQEDLSIICLIATWHGSVKHKKTHFILNVIFTSLIPWIKRNISNIQTTCNMDF